MKKFERPKIAFIQLTHEDMICTSGLCDSQICNGFDCPDCPTECSGTYHCIVFKCPTYIG